MVPGDMYKWSGGIFAKKTKFHDAGGPGTVVSPFAFDGCCLDFFMAMAMSPFSLHHKTFYEL